ncbi:hypothetical protein ACJX0J_022295, partial [Zea mays]
MLEEQKLLVICQGNKDSYSDLKIVVDNSILIIIKKKSCNQNKNRITLMIFIQGMNQSFLPAIAEINWYGRSKGEEGNNNCLKFLSIYINFTSDTIVADMLWGGAPFTYQAQEARQAKAVYCKNYNRAADSKFFFLYGWINKNSSRNTDCDLDKKTEYQRAQ